MKLTTKQAPKLRLAAEMLKATAHLHNPVNHTLLPLWGGGIITHGQPKSQALIIGISAAAQKATKATTTHDHLYRVTQTAKLILETIQKRPVISVSEIEQMLIDRAVYMVVTKSENIRLRNSAKVCTSENIFQPYHRAGIKYVFTESVIIYSGSSGTAYVPVVEDSPAFWSDLQKWILGQKPQVRKIVFRSDPNGIPTPQSFLNFCKSHGIEVVLESPERLEDQLAAEKEVSITRVFGTPPETEPTEED